MKAERADPIVRILLATSVVSALVAASAPAWWRFAGVDWPPFLHSIAVGLSLIAGGYIASRWRSGRAIARLMLLSAILYFIPFLGFGRSDAGYVIGLLTTGAWVAVAGHFVVAFPEGRLRSRAELAVVGAGYLWTTSIRSSVLFFDPTDFGCADCPRNLLLIDGRPELARLIDTVDSFVPVVVISLVMLLVLNRWRRATRPERRVLAPVFLAIAINVAAALGLSAVIAGQAAGLLPAGVPELAIFIQRSAILLLPLSFAVGIARGVLARSAVANLLVRIGRGNSVSEIERDVAWALGDPSATIALGVRGTTELRLADGKLLNTDELPAGSLTLVEGEDESRLALVHDPSLARDQPELLAAVASATRLALENHRLQDEVRLSRELPVGLAERLLREGNRVGETRTMTISVLMSDIRGYSALAEGAELHQLAAQLNEHRASMNRVIAGQGGTVMQFVGDMVFAVFGAPLPSRDHAARAVAAAREMQAAQAEINHSWRESGRPPFGIGIAVTTGDVAAAVLGSEEHVEYSVVGDVVNLAQRLQGWAAAGEVIVSQQTYQQLDGTLAALELPTATVKGRQAPVTAYRVAPA